MRYSTGQIYRLMSLSVRLPERLAGWMRLRWWPSQ